METLFFSAFALSLLFAAQPGVIGFEALRRGIAGGWSAALHVELGSLVGDAVWAALALLGASVLFQNQVLTLLLGLFGSGLIMRFAWEAWRASRMEQAFVTEGQARGNHFVAGAMLSLSNPQNITAWLGMSGVIIGLGFLNPQPVHLLVFFAGFMVAQVCWCFFFATVVEYGRRLMNPRVFRRINLACAFFLAYIGCQLFAQTLSILL